MEDQIYNSMLWGRMYFHELNESCRQSGSDKDFAELLSRARLGAEFMTMDDIAMLMTRLCSKHCRAECNKPYVRFVDVERTKEMVRGKREIVEHTHTVCHCPLEHDAIVAAALCEKVDELNNRAMDTIVSSGRHKIHTIYAKDIHEGKTEVIDAEYTKEISARLSNMKKILRVYLGMEVKHIHTFSHQSHAVTRSHT
jgi:hypothetical protein